MSACAGIKNCIGLSSKLVILSLELVSKQFYCFEGPEDILIIDASQTVMIEIKARYHWNLMTQTLKTNHPD